MKKVFVLFVVALCAVSLVLSCKKKESDSVSIGAIFPLSGPVAFYGNESRDGALLAMEQVNAAGGLLGKNA